MTTTLATGSDPGSNPRFSQTRDRMKNSNRSRGFTLMELVFAMMVLAILVGVSFAGASYLWKGEKVETCARGMQSVMMRALRMSVANQQPYSVVLDASQLRLVRTGDVPALQDGDEVEGVEKGLLPSGVEVYIRRWEERQWRRVEFETLDFPVSGICEPVSFRLVHGGDVLEFSLHPLTAFPIEETLVVE